MTEYTDDVAKIVVGGTITTCKTTLVLQSAPDRYHATLNITTPWGSQVTKTFYYAKRQKITDEESGSTLSIMLLGVNIDKDASFSITYDEIVATTGKISCISTPSGATIFLDDRQQQSPTNITLTGVTAGAHTIRYELDGYESVSKTVSVTAGNTVTVSATLTAIGPAKTILTLKSPGTEVTEGEIITLEGTLKTEDGQGVGFATIEFYDADIGEDQPLKTLTGENLTAITMNGMFSASWSAVSMDKEYLLNRANIIAKFAGTSDYAESKSQEFPVHIVQKEAVKTQITLAAKSLKTGSSTEIQEGEILRISGTLTTEDGKAVTNKKLTFYDSDAYILSSPLKDLNGATLSATTGDDGAFTADWTAEKMDLIGAVDIFAKFGGDSEYEESKSEVIKINVLNPGPKRTILTLSSLTPSEVVMGDKVTITGTLKTEDGNGLTNAKIYFFDKDLLFDDGLTEGSSELMATTGSGGSFSVLWTSSSMEGLSGWTGQELEIYAKFNGTDDYEKSTSGVKTLAIKSSEMPFIIRSNPDDVTIYVDGQSTGKKTPVTLNLSIGTHEITGKIENPWYIPESLTEDMPEGLKLPDVSNTIEVSYDTQQNTTTLEFVEPSALCKLFGAETMTECQSTITIGALDLLYDVESFSKIVMHKSMYDGKAAEAGTWDYIAAGLSIFPLVGGIVSTTGKIGIELLGNGRRLARAISKENRIATVFNEELFFNRLVTMNADEIAEVISRCENIAKSSGTDIQIGLDSLRSYIRRFDLDEIPQDTIARTQSELAKIMDEEDVVKVLEYFYKLGDIASNFGKHYTDLFEGFLAGTKVLELDDIKTFAQHAQDHPDEVIDLVERYGVNQVAAVGIKLESTTVYGHAANTMLKHLLAVIAMKGDGTYTVAESLKYTQFGGKRGMNMLVQAIEDSNINEAIQLLDQPYANALFKINSDVARKYLDNMISVFENTQVNGWAADIGKAADDGVSALFEKAVSSPAEILPVIKNVGTGETSEIVQTARSIATKISSNNQAAEVISRNIPAIKKADEIANTVNTATVPEEVISASFDIAKSASGASTEAAAEEILDATDDVMVFMTRIADGLPVTDEAGNVAGSLIEISTKHKTSYRNLANNLNALDTPARTGAEAAKLAASTGDDFATAAKLIEDTGKGVADEVVEEALDKVDDLAESAKDAMKEWVPAKFADEAGSGASSFVQKYADYLTNLVTESTIVTPATIKGIAAGVLDNPAELFNLIDEIDSGATNLTLVVDALKFQRPHGIILASFLETGKMFKNMYKTAGGSSDFLHVWSKFINYTTKAADISDSNYYLNIIGELVDGAGAIRPLADILASKSFKLLDGVSTFVKKYYEYFNDIVQGRNISITATTVTEILQNTRYYPEELFTLVDEIELATVANIIKNQKPYGAILANLLEYGYKFKPLYKSLTDYTDFEHVWTKLMEHTMDAVNNGDLTTYLNILSELVDGSGVLKSLDDIMLSTYFRSLANLSASAAKYVDFFDDIVNGTNVAITDDTINKLIELTISTPDDLYAIIDNTNIESLLPKLARMGEKGIFLGEYLRMFTKIGSNKSYIGDVFLDFTTETAEAAKVAYHAGAKTTLADIYDTLFDEIDNFKPWDDVLDSKYYDQLYLLSKELSKTEFTYWRKRAGSVFGSYLQYITAWTKAHPYATGFIGSATGTGLLMAVWFLLDNVPFYWLMYNKIQGTDPGTPSYRISMYLEGISTLGYNGRTYCEQKNYTKLTETITDYESQLTDLKTYMAENQEQLVQEGAYEAAADVIVGYEGALDLLKECVPEEMEPPANGSNIYENVVIKTIIDGDTVEALIPGYEDTKRIRLAGCNTPDKASYGGYEFVYTYNGEMVTKTTSDKDIYMAANNYLNELLNEQTVSLKVDPDDLYDNDEYRRLVAVIIMKDGTEANKTIIEKGYGGYMHYPSWTITDNDPVDHDTYKAAMQTAMDAKLGVWGAFLDLPDTETNTVLFKAYKESSTGTVSGTTAEIWSNKAGEQSAYLYTASASSEKTWPVGVHSVIFKKTGYQDIVKNFEVSSGNTTIVEAIWTYDETPSGGEEESTAYVDISVYKELADGSISGTSGISVSIDGNYAFLMTSSTKSGYEINPGTHTFLFEKEGYDPATVTVTAVKGEHVPVRATLKPEGTSGSEDPGEEDEGSDESVAYFDISVYKQFLNGGTSGTTATVYLDGEYNQLMKSSSIVGFEVMPGIHELKFEKLGYKSVTVTKNAIADKHVPITVTMILGEDEDEDDGTGSTDPDDESPGDGSTDPGDNNQDPGDETPDDNNAEPAEDVAYINLQVTLMAIDGTYSDATNVTVYIDGVYKFNMDTNKNGYPVQPGLHEIKFAKTGYIPITTSLTAIKDKTVGAAVTLMERGINGTPTEEPENEENPPIDNPDDIDPGDGSEDEESPDDGNSTEEPEATPAYIDILVYRAQQGGTPIGTTAVVFEADDYLFMVSNKKTGVEVEPGDHTYTFEKEGYDSEIVNITAVAGKTKLISVTLSESTTDSDDGDSGDNDAPDDNNGDDTPGDDDTGGEDDTTPDDEEEDGNTTPVEPENAIIDFAVFRETSDGTTYGTTAAIMEDDVYLFLITSTKKGYETEPGDHTYRFEKQGYLPQEITITTLEGTRHLVTAVLTMDEEEEEEDDSDSNTDPVDEEEVQSGYLDVVSDPTNAAIYVDNRYMGHTKKANLVLEAGVHEIKLVKSEYDTWTDSITIVADEHHLIEAELEYSYDAGDYYTYESTTYPSYITGTTELTSGTGFSGSTGAGTTGSTEKSPDEPWVLLKDDLNVVFISIGEKSKNQDNIISETKAFIDKHAPLGFTFEELTHNEIIPDSDDNGEATLDDPDYIKENMNLEKTPENADIIYLIWNPGTSKDVAYDGITNGIDEQLWGALICSSPNTGKEVNFNETTGRVVNDRLKVTYKGTLTLLISLIDSLQELYINTKDDSAEDMPELDKDYCSKQYHDNRANAKCIVNWLNELKENLPEDIKK